MLIAENKSFNINFNLFFFPLIQFKITLNTEKYFHFKQIIRNNFYLNNLFLLLN